ncbi:MAG: GNAT family N-acetyltransferase [Bacteroidales bacterium]|nr:GNAT family N-acetyltransferase [Bacteroidales bacterium]
MSVKIIEVKGRRGLRKFITWPETLYKDCPGWVPPLVSDEFDTLDPQRNAAFEFCEAQCFLAYRDGAIAGRVAAIINRRANEIWKQSIVRFGWLDFVEDAEVLKALLDSVAQWGRQRGCNRMKGPLGFTDMDKEGLLVEGYEHLSPFTCLYNYPYYDTLLKDYGLNKDVDWTQSLVYIDPADTPASYSFADKITERFGIRVYRAKSMKEMGDKYGMEVFHMYNETFAPLFQFTPLSDRQIKRYLKTYLSILDPDFVALAVNEKDEPVGFIFCVPTLSSAVKKCRGRLFPFGFINVMKALRHNDAIEALMIGVLPEYQSKGAALLMFKYIHENCVRRGIKKMILNPQLEDNAKVQSLFGEYRTEPFMRRRAYSMDIDKLKI